ncbi:MAG: SDR family oxidoreductase [Chloroflexi bacterium]|nr:SDR family oxidoreductase [Chloroflexota bacterium]
MNWSADSAALRDRVAVVAGATRGAGRGIAAALGEAGATVICTGRSTRSHRSEYDRAETIEETAELVRQLGGVGVALAADHLDPEQVRALADQIRTEYGHIDVLVNDIWGAEKIKGRPPDWNKPIWQHNLDDGLRILRLAIDTHLITSYYIGHNTVSSGQLAREYGFTDLDSSRPDIWRYIHEVREPGLDADLNQYR